MKHAERHLPTGTVTFFFSDIEESTTLWEAHPQGMRAALARHDQILRAAVSAAGGTVIKTTGDGMHAVFSAAGRAVEAAIAAQKALVEESWQAISPDTLKVRMGLHSGEAEEREGDYFGPVVNRAARLMAIGHGGQVLLSGVTAALVGDLNDEIDLSEIGDVRLRGLNRPEHVYQLVVDGLPSTFPPLNTEAAVAGNLPGLLTSFVGRERERGDVMRLLEQTRLLTLTGPGGTGKTRLSLEVAGDAQDSYAHGAWLVELAPLSDPAGVPAAVAGLWNLSESPGLTLEETLEDYLRGKQMLLILDNCEHLVAASAQLAADLLAHAPRLTILASSREGLGVPGETTYHLPTLRIPEREVVDAQALQSYESVQLFIDRARAVRPAFELTSQNAAAVGRIVRRLDGIPLAIELAAARLKLLPPEQLAERLDDRFRLLTGGSRTALPRQQTLRALIDWSYDYLDPAEQALFRQLGVFAGGWTLDAAEAVVDLSDLETRIHQEKDFAERVHQETGFLDVLDLLANLVNKSLVLMEEEDGQARFGLLETIRQYARDRLFEAGEGVVARDRHLDYFASLVIGDVQTGDEEAYVGLFAAIGHPDLVEWVKAIHADIDNVRAAMQWALQYDPERALAMSIKLSLFFVFEGASPEILQWLKESIQAVQEMAPATPEAARQRTLLQLQGLVWYGNLQFGNGDNLRAIEILQTAIDMARQGHFKATLSMALGLQAVTLSFIGRYDAYDKATEALAIQEELGLTSLQSLPLSTMATIKMQQGEYEEALALQQRAAAQRGDTNPFIEGLSLLTMARFANQNIDWDSVEKLLEQARKGFMALGSRPFEAVTESEMGHLRRYRGDDDGAAAIYRHTIRTWQDLGSSAAVANQLEVFGFIAIHREQYERAAVLLGAAEVLREQIRIEMLPSEQKEYGVELATLRREFSAAKLQHAWQTGRGLTMDAAVDFALAADSGEMNGY
ncbi:MAG: ATP-binding protein [Candidatus Promineifilaceae bacterium]